MGEIVLTIIYCTLNFFFFEQPKMNEINRNTSGYFNFYTQQQRNKRQVLLISTYLSRQKKHYTWEQQ